MWQIQVLWNTGIRYLVAGLLQSSAPARSAAMISMRMSPSVSGHTVLSAGPRLGSVMELSKCYSRSQHWWQSPEMQTVPHEQRLLREPRSCEGHFWALQSIHWSSCVWEHTLWILRWLFPQGPHFRDFMDFRSAWKKPSASRPKLARKTAQIHLDGKWKTALFENKMSPRISKWNTPTALQNICIASWRLKSSFPSKGDL